MSGNRGWFSVVFSGNLPISYNWQKSPDGSTWTNIPGSTNPTATNNTFAIASTQSTDAGVLPAFCIEFSLELGDSSHTDTVGSVQITPGTPNTSGRRPPVWRPKCESNPDEFPFDKQDCRGNVCHQRRPAAGRRHQPGDIVFGANGVGSIGVSGFTGYGTGASTNQTGNASFNTCLNDFVYDNTQPFHLA